MAKLRDVREFIPRTDQTNANKFPRPDDPPQYPKMLMTGEGNKVHRDETGAPIVVNNREEEEAFLNAQGDAGPSEETDTGDFQEVTKKKSKGGKPKDLD